MTLAIIFAFLLGVLVGAFVGYTFCVRLMGHVLRELGIKKNEVR